MVFDPKGVFSFRPDGESRKTRFERNWTTFVNLAFALLEKAHSKWWYETELVVFDPKGVVSFRPDRESQKRRFERNWTTFVYPAFFPDWKSQLKMVE